MSLLVKINGCFLKYKVFSSIKLRNRLGSFSKGTDPGVGGVLRGGRVRDHVVFQGLAGEG